MGFGDPKDNEWTGKYDINGIGRDDPLPSSKVEGTIEKTLKERGSKYGRFDAHAATTQDLKKMMQERAGWARLSYSQREALEMIAHKIGRILNGDPNYADSWHDIAGYATLIEKELNGRQY